MTMTEDRRIQAHARRIAVELALEDALKTRDWYAVYGVPVLGWRDWAKENRAQVRRLVTMLRRERGR